MMINLNGATFPQLFVHYRDTHPFKQPQPMCCPMRRRYEDQPEQSK